MAGLVSMRHFGQFPFPWVESAGQTFRLFKYVAAYETATNFMAPRASSCGWGARFDLLYEPGRCRAWRGGTERQANHRRLATTSDVNFDSVLKRTLVNVRNAAGSRR
jgi:hypothetical protein